MKYCSSLAMLLLTDAIFSQRWMIYLHSISFVQPREELHMYPSFISWAPYVQSNGKWSIFRLQYHIPLSFHEPIFFLHLKSCAYVCVCGWLERFSRSSSRDRAVLDEMYQGEIECVIQVYFGKAFQKVSKSEDRCCSVDLSLHSMLNSKQEENSQWWMLFPCSHIKGFLSKPSNWILINHSCIERLWENEFYRENFS